MPTYTEMVSRAHDNFLDIVKRAEDRSAGMVESAGRAASDITPTRLLIERLDSTVPRQELVRLTLGFSERLISQQRDYAEKLAAALGPAGSRARSPRTRAQSSKTRRPAARPRTTATRSSGGPDNRAASVNGAAART